MVKPIKKKEQVLTEANCKKHEWEEVASVMRCKNCGKGACWIKKGAV